MFDFRLKVFYTVAQRLSFTRAASELFISQPAVTKHIRELEDFYKSPLFERSGNSKVSITPAGMLLLKYAEQILSLSRDLEYDMSMLRDKYSGTLRIGASTTIAQYLLPSLLAGFHKKFRDIRVSMISGNTEEIEQALINKQIEVGFIEGLSKKPQIHYSGYLNDEIVLVCPSHFHAFKKDTLSIDELTRYPLLMREPGSGTLEVIAHALKPFGLRLNDLNIEMQLGSTEGIKSYLAKSDCLAFISVHAIFKELKHRELRVIDVESLNIERPLQIAVQHGQPSKLADLFIEFVHKNSSDWYNDHKIT